MATKKRKAQSKPAKGADQGPIGNTTGVYIPVPKPNTSGGATKIPIEAATPEEQSFLEKQQQALQGKIDDWVAAQGDSKLAMAGGALATALNQVLFPTAVWELVPVGKVFKLVKKGKQAAEAALKAKKAEQAVEDAAKAKKAAQAEKQAGKKADKEVKKAGDKDGGRVDPKKQKPHKDCGNFAKYSKQPRNNGLEKDHTPSVKALEKAALDKLRARPDFEELSKATIESITASIKRNSPTIAIPPDVHSEGNTWRGKNTAQRSTADSKDLRGAAKRDTDAIQKSMDQKDHGCSEKYAQAAKRLREFDFDKLIDDTINSQLKP